VFNISVILDLKGLDNDRDVVFCIGTNNKYFVTFYSMDNEIKIAGVEGGLWVAPGNNKPLFRTDNLVGRYANLNNNFGLNGKNQRRTTIPNGNASEWNVISPKNGPFNGNNKGPLTVNIFGDRVNDITHVTYSRGTADAITIIYQSTFDINDDINIYMDADNFVRERIRVKNITSINHLFFASHKQRLNNNNNNNNNLLLNEYKEIIIILLITVSVLVLLLLFITIKYLKKNKRKEYSKVNELTTDDISVRTLQF